MLKPIWKNHLKMIKTAGDSATLLKLEKRNYRGIIGTYVDDATSTGSVIFENEPN